MEKLENILVKYNCVKRTEKSTTDINRIESQIKHGLPADYRYYLQNYFGFEECVGEEFVQLWALDNILQLNMEYEIFNHLPGTLGIGGNGGGEFIGIEFLDNNNYRIILTPLIDLESEYHIEIGSSFTDFLVRLDNGDEWSYK